MQSGSGKAPVIQALAALHWMHVKADHKDPTTHPTVRQLKEAICSILSQPACRCWIMTRSSVDDLVVNLIQTQKRQCTTDASLYAFVIDEVRDTCTCHPWCVWLYVGSVNRPRDATCPPTSLWLGNRQKNKLETKEVKNNSQNTKNLHQGKTNSMLEVAYVWHKRLSST